MKELAPYTKLTPTERVKDTKTIIDVINRSDSLNIG
jgi:hypothetical protein